MTKMFGIYLWLCATGFARYKFCGLRLLLCTHGSTQYCYAPMVPHNTKFFVFCSPTSIDAGCDAYAATTRK